MRTEIPNPFMVILVVLLLSNTSAAVIISGTIVVIGGEDMMNILNMLFRALKVLVLVQGACWIIYGVWLTFISVDTLRRAKLTCIFIGGIILTMMGAAFCMIPNSEYIMSVIKNFR